MGTEEELNNDDDNSDEEPDQGDEENRLIKDLRKQLRAKDKELGSLRPLKESVAFLEAGLGNLSDDHKTALRAVVKDDYSKDNLLAKAKFLGFSAEKANEAEEQQEQENKEIQGEVSKIQHGEESMSRPTGKPDTRDFLTKIKQAKSREELMQLLASEGEEHGMLVEQEF